MRFSSYARRCSFILSNRRCPSLKNNKKRYLTSKEVLSSKFENVNAQVFVDQKRNISGGPTKEPLGENDDEHLRELSPSLFQTIKDERKHTMKEVDNMLQTYLPGVTRSSIEKEIQEASMKLSSTSPIGEIGPTGIFEYSFHDNALLGTRMYRRKDRRDLTGQEFPVFHIDFHKEHLGQMSLSVDEKYAMRLTTYTGESSSNVARIIEKASSMPRQQISIRNIARQEDIVLNVFPSAGTKQRKIHNVEFGPRVVICKEKDHYAHTIFYTLCDELGRPSEVHACLFYTNTQSNSTPEIIFQDSNPNNFVDIQRTKGCDYVAIHATSKMSNEIRLVGLRGGSERGFDTIIRNDQDGSVHINWSPILVREREHGVQYYVDCGNQDDVIILAHQISDKGKSRKKDQLLGQEMSLFEDRIFNLPQSSDSFGREIQSHSALVKEESTTNRYFMENMDIFENHIVLFERSFTDGTQRLQTIERKSGDRHIIPFDMFEERKGVMLSAAGNIHYQSSTFRFLVESPVEVPITMEYNFHTKGVTCLDRVEEEDTYKYFRKLVSTGEDQGLSIPLTIVCDKKYGDINCPHAIVLIGYNAYGENQNLSYNPALLPLVKRGFAIAYCHGRGGSELGQQWYEAGCRLNKKNGIADFLSCAKYFKESDLFHSNSEEDKFIAAKAFSAGGVVVGAAVNESPHTFQSVSLTNSFLDVLGSMSNTNHYLTDHERDEFGNPEDINYCPLANVSAQTYPPMLLIGTLDDENVPFHHALVFGRRVRKHCEENATEVLVHIEMDGGHNLHGSYLEISSLEVSFILSNFAKWRARQH